MLLKRSCFVELLNFDKYVYEDVGIIVFKNFGILMMGFEYFDDDDLVILVFFCGFWDEDFEVMRVY